MDIGCYPVTLSRMLFGAEPLRVIGLIERDPDMKIDRLTSAMLEYRHPAMRRSLAACRLHSYQRLHLRYGGRIELRIPFNAPPEGRHACSSIMARASSVVASRNGI